MEKEETALSHKALYLGITIIVINLMLMAIFYLTKVKFLFLELANSSEIPFLIYMPLAVFIFLGAIGIALIAIYFFKARAARKQQKAPKAKLLKKNEFYLRQAIAQNTKKKAHSLQNALFLIIGNNQQIESDVRINPDDSPEKYPFEWHTIDDGIYINLNNKPPTEGLPGSAEQWPDFMKWLYTIRARRPINGVILTFSFHTLLEAKPNTQFIETLDLLDDIRKSTKEAPPIYLVIDEVDAIQGAEEHFNSRQTPNSKLLGVTLEENATDKHNVSIRSELEHFFTENHLGLLNELNGREGSTNRNSFFFLKQLQSIKNAISTISNELSTRNALIRGVYFATSKRRQSIRDYANQKATSLYSVQPTDIALPNTTGQQTFRLEDILRNVTLEESGLAEDSLVFKSRQRYRFIATYLVTGLLVTAFTSTIYYLYQKNLAELEQDTELVKARYPELNAHSKQNNKTTEPEDHLATLNFLRGSLGNDTGFLHRTANLGLSKDTKVQSVVYRKYIDAIKTKFLQSIVAGQLNYAETLSLNTNIAEQSKAFDALRIIKLLSSGQDSKKEHKQKTLLAALPAHWKRKFHKDKHKQEVVKSLTTHLGEVVKHDMQHQISSREQIRIKTVQRKLASISIPQRLYSLIKTQTIDTYPTPFELRSELGDGVDEVFQGGSGATSTFNRFFTREGFLQTYIENNHEVAALAAFDAWALGEKATPTQYEGEDLEAIQQQLESLYLNEYAQQWQRAINSIRLLPTRNLAELNALLETLAKSGSYRNLLTSIHHNTVFEADEKSEKEEKKEGADAPESGKEQETAKQRRIDYATQTLQRKFKAYNQLLPKKIDDIDAALGDLSKYMKKLESAKKGKPYLALSLLTAKFSEKGSETPMDVLALTANDLPVPLSNQLNTLVNECWKILISMATADLNQAWQDEVYSFYAENLQGRYPFQKTAQEASLKSVEEFYGAKGILAVFHETYLQPLIDNKGELNGLKINGIEQVYKHADFITEGLFDKGGKLKLEFTLEPTGLSTVYMASTFTIGGVAIKYNHGRPAPAAVIWPDPKAPLAAVTLNPLDRNANAEQQSAEGEWALFRLLDTAKTQALGDRIRDISFSGKAGVMNYTIQAPKSINPLTKDLFSDFHLPPVLVGGTQPLTDNSTASTQHEERIY